MEAARQNSRMLALSFLRQKYPPLGPRLRGKGGKAHSPFSPDQNGCICPPAPWVQLFHPELAACEIHTTRIGRIFRYGLWTRSTHLRLRFDSRNLRRKIIVIRTTAKLFRRRIVKRILQCSQRRCGGTSAQLSNKESGFRKTSLKLVDLGGR